MSIFHGRPLFLEIFFIDFQCVLAYLPLTRYGIIFVMVLSQPACMESLNWGCAERPQEGKGGCHV